jgi:DNA adenine methylase
VHDARGDAHAYAFEMTDADHRDLAEALRNVEGKVALSGYHCDLMDELYGDWTTVEYTKRAHSVKQDRTEVLWVNYPVEQKRDGTCTCQTPQTSSNMLFEEQEII